MKLVNRSACPSPAPVRVEKKCPFETDQDEIGKGGVEETIPFEEP